MTSMRKRTMRGSVAARDALVNSVAILIEVAEQDLVDELVGDSDPMLDRERRRFAAALVDRMLFDDDILLDWIGEEQDDDRLWNDDGVPQTYEGIHPIAPLVPEVAVTRGGLRWGDIVGPLHPGDRVTLQVGEDEIWHGTVKKGASMPEHVRVQWDHLGPGDPDDALISALKREAI